MFRHVYVIKTSDKEAEKQSVYEFEDEESAIADMYNLHGVALKNEKLQATFSLTLNEKGEEIERLSASIPDSNNKRCRYEIKPRVYWYTIKKEGEELKEEFKIYAYDTKQYARGTFYTKYAACRNDKNCLEATVACINGEGINLELKVWSRETGTTANDNETDNEQKDIDNTVIKTVDRTENMVEEEQGN